MPFAPPDHQYVFTLAYSDFSARVEISRSYTLHRLAELLIEAVGFH